VAHHPPARDLRRPLRDGKVAAAEETIGPIGLMGRIGPMSPIGPISCSPLSAFAAGESEVLIKPVVGAEDAFSLAQGQPLGLGLGGVEYPPDQVR